MEGTKNPGWRICQLPRAVGFHDPDFGIAIGGAAPRRRLPSAIPCHVFLCVLASWIVIAWPETGRADTGDHAAEASVQGSYYGAFVGFELKTGTALLGIDPTNDRGPHERFRPLVAGSFRFANLLSLIDVDLGAALTFGPETTSNGRFDIVHARFGAEARLHPFFMSHLQGKWLRASLHLAFGLALDVQATRPLGAAAAPGSLAAHSGTQTGLAISWGFGLDIPLSDMVTADPSVWLGLGYRMRFVGFNAAPLGLGDRDGHDIFVSLSVRWHDIGFARFPRPRELDDRDRP